MSQGKRAKVNVKFLVALLLVVAAIGASLVFVRQALIGIQSDGALRDGLAAYEKDDWPEAAQKLRSYLLRQPEDVDVLRTFADACLNVRPLGAGEVGGAISAYRKIVELDPMDHATIIKLAELYRSMGNYAELEQVARLRLERESDDATASLWFAEALIHQDKQKQAEKILRMQVEQLAGDGMQHEETFVWACIWMSRLAKDGVVDTSVTGDSETLSERSPLAWLDRAVTYAPKSAEALVYRAQFYRLQSLDSDRDETERQQLAMLARVDLETASSVGTENPMTGSLLISEWLALREYSHAQAVLQQMEQLSEECVSEHFYDVIDWTARKFMMAAQLALRQGMVDEGTVLANQVLDSLESEQHRLSVLPGAIQLYVAAGNADRASAALEEYTSLLGTLATEVDSEQLAWLKGLVKGAAGQSYDVINALESVGGEGASYARQLRLLAFAYADTGQFSRAVETMNEYLNYYPNDGNVLLRLAKLYALQRRWPQAGAAAQRAEDVGVTDPLLRLIRMGADLSASDQSKGGVVSDELERFSKELVQFQQQYPDRADIFLFRSVLAMQQGRPEDVESILKQGMAVCEKPLQLEMFLVQHYFDQQREDDALRLCQAACERHAAVSMPWCILADLHTAAGDVDIARDVLHRAQTMVSEGTEERLVTIKLAGLELIQGDRGIGLELLQALADQDEREVQARLLLLETSEIRQDSSKAQSLITELRNAEGDAGLYWRVHQANLWLESETWLSKRTDIDQLLQYCMKADPRWPAPVILLASMHQRLGDMKQVENLYRQGLQNNPEATGLADRLLSLLEGQQRFVDAQQLLQKMGNDPRATYWRPRILEGMGDSIRAMDAYRLRMSNDSQDVTSRVQLSRLIYQESKDVEQALRYLEEARRIAPNSRTVHAVHASILREEGRVTEAMQVLDNYVKEVNSFDAFWMRAVFFTEQGDFERAEQDYKQLTTYIENGAAGYELLSRFYADRGQVDAGINTLQKAGAVYPASRTLRGMLVRLLYQRNNDRDREQARSLLMDLRSEFPDDPEFMTLWAEQAIQQSVSSDALASAAMILEKAIQLDPHYVQAWLLLIDVKVRQGELSQAAQLAGQALESIPNNKILKLRRGRLELMLGNGSTAFYLARDVVRQSPDDVEAYMLLANSALAGGNSSLWEQAFKELENALLRYPAHEGLLISYAQISTALKKSQQAIVKLEKFCQQEPGAQSVPGLVTLIDLYRLVGDWDRAEKTLNRAEQLAPEHQMVVHARMQIRVAQGQFDNLSGISNAYIQATSKDLAISRRAALMLWSLDVPELSPEAMNLFEHNIQQWPDSLEVRLDLASTQYAIGKVDRARTLYEALHQEYPNNARVLNDLAWILQEQGQNYDKALALANRGVQLAPNNESLLDTRATIFTKMPDRLNDAKRDFDTLRRLSLLEPERRPRLAQTLLKLARVCVRVEEYEDAKRYIDQATEIDKGLGIFSPEEKKEMVELLQQSSVAK